ncbi:1019_t:CDS:1, partial [Gigaspora rosea]
IQACSRIQNNRSSDAMFSVTDTNTSHKVQIAEDIASFLRQTYFQRYHPSLGRVHEVHAT